MTESISSDISVYSWVIRTIPCRNSARFCGGDGGCTSRNSKFSAKYGAISLGLPTNETRWRTWPWLTLHGSGIGVDTVDVEFPHAAHTTPTAMTNLRTII